MLTTCWGIARCIRHARLALSGYSVRQFYFYALQSVVQHLSLCPYITTHPCIRECIQNTYCAILTHFAPLSSVFRHRHSSTASAPPHLRSSAAGLVRRGTPLSLYLLIINISRYFKFPQFFYQHIHGCRRISLLRGLRTTGIMLFF